MWQRPFRATLGTTLDARELRLRILILPLSVIATSTLLAFLFGDQLVFPDEYDDVVIWLREQADWAWLVGVGVIMADALLPVPSTPAMFAMGVIYGPLVGGLICGTALTIAGMLGFSLVRAMGRRGALVLMGEKDLAATERFYERWGTPAIVLGRAIGGPAEWAVILAGLSNVPASRAFAATAVGGYASGGVVAALGSMSIQEPLWAVAITVAFLGLLLGVARAMTRAADEAPPGDADR